MVFVARYAWGNWRRRSRSFDFKLSRGLLAAQIAGTRAGDAVKMLEALVREYPTRENLWLELARGLNRLGRRDAALNAIQRAREALREHLGVHPSALLSALETDLLTGHAALPARSDEIAVPGQCSPRRPRVSWAARSR